MSRRTLEQHLAEEQSRVAALDGELRQTIVERDTAERELHGGLRGYISRTVVVHQNGPSIQGVLTGVYKDCLVLRVATNLDADTELGGEIAVPRAQGVHVQIPDTEAR